MYLMGNLVAQLTSLGAVCYLFWYTTLVARSVPSVGLGLGFKFACISPVFGRPNDRFGRLDIDFRA